MASPETRRFRLSFQAIVALLCSTIALIGIVSLWYHFIRPYHVHRKVYDRIGASIESLTHRRPAGVSKNEWSYVIGWTMNARGNCCSVPSHLNPGEESHRRFETLPDRLEDRLRGEVTLETIDWLWDEFEVISKYGKRYSERWRPTTPEHLAEADSVQNGIVVD